jgi:hypothetical protein
MPNTDCSWLSLFFAPLRILTEPGDVMETCEARLLQKDRVLAAMAQFFLFLKHISASFAFSKSKPENYWLSLPALLAQKISTYLLMCCEIFLVQTTQISNTQSLARIYLLWHIKNTNRTRVCLYSSLCCSKIKLHCVICSERFLACLHKLCELE